MPAFPLPHSGNQPSQLLGGIDQTLFDQRLVVGQAGDEAAEGAFTWHSIAQATDFPELPAAAHPLQQLVIVANLQQELDQVGPPHGPDRVAGASGAAVVLEDFEKGLVFEAVEDGG